MGSEENVNQTCSAGLMGLNLDDDSDMEDFDDMEMGANVLADVLGNADDDDDLIMCCCKKEERHDETMKFVCR